jgi:nucleoside-diphosphate-sugar epimerase
MKIENKKIIVTGAAGVIGRELVKKLTEQKAIVRCFDIMPRPKIFSSEVEYCQEDLLRLNPIEFIRFDPIAIFHLAATFERTEEDISLWESSYLNNVLLSHKVIDVAKECMSLQKFIFASSYLIYDSAYYLSKNFKTGSIALKEKNKVNPRNLVGVAKYYTEKELEYISNLKKYFFRSISTRIFRVYGKGSRDIISRWIRAGLRKEKIELFLKENSFDYIFGEDVAEGLLKLAQNDEAQGVVNLGSGKSSQIKEIVEIIKKQISLLKVEEVDKKKNFEASCADVTQLEKLINWRPEISIEQGIKKIINYETNKKN